MGSWAPVRECVGVIVLTGARLTEANFPGIAPPFLLVLETPEGERRTIGIATLARCAQVILQTSTTRAAQLAHLACGADESESELRDALFAALAHPHALQ